MRHVIRLCVVACLGLSACAGPGDRAEVDRALADLDAADRAALNDIMLASADPAEAVAYFEDALNDDPGNTALRRSLAGALLRAGDTGRAAGMWARIVEAPDSRPEDRVALAGALVRTGDWAGAEAQLGRVPAGIRSYERYRLEAMIADSNADWDRADTFYESASELTTRPANVLNNWGYSQLTRGDPAAAERLFTRALSHDPTLFTAKNNLVLARSAQRDYSLPVLPTSQTDRARLLHTMALGAIKQGDVAIGRGLLRESLDTHPQHFEPAARALAALSSTVTN